MSNPFNPTFGELPKNVVPREKDFETIKETFNDENPESKVYIISGPRGSGKTVLLTALSQSFEEDGYIVTDLNHLLGDLHEQFASQLYEKGRLKKLFLQPEFSFSFKGIGFSIKGNKEISNVSTLLDTMLTYLSKKGKKVLIVIDDVSSNDNLRAFVYTYQQLIRRGYGVYFLMSGLYENVSELERHKSLTFLLRSPKLTLEPLSLYDIVYSYKNALSLTEEEAVRYAKLTKGYAYGYQLLGSLLYKNGKEADIIDEYDNKLIKNSYLLTWESLTAREKDFLSALARSSSQKEIRDALNMSNGNLQTYKRRLVDKGLIASSRRGEMAFTLPRFKEFVQFENKLNAD